ncbi:MAG: ABC transporter ATP-binding protein [Alphaproteobacteria bacterium]
MTDLAARNVRVKLGGRTILHGVDFELAPGRLVALVGPNGAGKTTLLRAMAALLPFEGAILLGGRPVESFARRAFARTVSFLPQGQLVHWPLSVRRLVALARLPHLAPWQRPGRSDHEAIERAMDRTDIWMFAERPVTTLSAGERARALFARALAVEAPVLLADEPVAALDPYHQLQMMELLRAYADDGRAVAVVLHDLTLASRFCDRVSLVAEGRPVADGPPDAVFTDDNLRLAYGVEVLRGAQDGQTFVLPWRRLP